MTGIAHREAGQEQEFEQLGFGETRGRLLARELLAHDGAAQRIEIDARAVVGHADEQRARAVARFERDRAFFGLAERAAQRRASSMP